MDEQVEQAEKIETANIEDIKEWAQQSGWFKLATYTSDKRIKIVYLTKDGTKVIRQYFGDNAHISLHSA